jgi:hypothetical protein
MSFLKSKAFWFSIATIVIVVGIIFRVPKARQLVTGQAA